MSTPTSISAAIPAENTDPAGNADPAGNTEPLLCQDLEPTETRAANNALCEAPAKFFYGWLMLPLAMLLMVASSPGQTFGFSFFNSHFREAFALKLTDLTAVYLFATIIASVALPYIGGLTDRFGLKSSVLVAIVSLAGVCVLMSQAQGVAMLFLSFLFFRILGPGTLCLLAGNTLARWFDRRLGMASAIMQASMAGAMAFVPTGMVWLMDAFEWRGAYLAMAAILAGGLLPLLAILYRESPRHLGQFPDGERPTLDQPMITIFQTGMTVKEAKQHRAFWILLVAAAIWALIGTGFVFHLVGLFQAQGLEEVSAKLAAKRAMTFMAISMGTSQLLAGLLADRLAMRWLVVSGVGLIAVSCVMLALGNLALLTFGYAVYGVANGFMSIIASTAWARYFGRAHLGKIRGVSLTAAIAGSSLGPLLMGVSQESLGSFEPALWLFAASAMGIAVACLWATPPRTNEA